MVDNYLEYYTVMTLLFSLVKHIGKGVPFPGSSEFLSLTVKELETKVTLLRDNYLVRRKVDGTKYVLLYDGNGLYLIARHMRAVLRLSVDSWLGKPLSLLGKVCLEGDLVRLSRERNKEKFMVTDVLHWSEKDSPLNTMLRTTWKERQAHLSANLCAEHGGFFSKSSVIIVHQESVAWDKCLELLEPSDFPSDGVVLQPHRSAIDPVYVWRPPQSITLDLRLGQMLSSVAATPAADSNHPESGSPTGTTRTTGFHHNETLPPTKVFAVEAYSRGAKAYVRLGTDGPLRLASDTVEIRRHDVVEGCICVCGIEEHVASSGKLLLHFHRVRYDVQRAMYKENVEEILRDGLIPRSRFVSWLNEYRFVASSTGSALPTRNMFGINAPTTQTKDDNEGTNVVQHFNRAKYVSLSTGETRSLPQPPTDEGNIATLQKVVPVEVKVQPKSTLEVVVKNVSYAPAPQTSPAVPPPPSATNIDPPPRNARERSQQRECNECKRPKEAQDGRVDPKDKKFYCFSCWAKAETEFCAECGGFKKGYRQLSRRHSSSFYCADCWGKYNEQQEKSGKPKSEKPQKSAGKEAVDVTEKEADDADTKKQGRRRKPTGKGEAAATASAEDTTAEAAQSANPAAENLNPAAENVTPAPSSEAPAATYADF